MAVTRWLTAALLVIGSGPLAAQARRPPEAGGRTFSLSQPKRWHFEGSAGAGAWFEPPGAEALYRAGFGVFRDLLSPITGLASVGLEGYAGMRGTSLDGGARAMYRIPYLSLGTGADYNFLDQKVQWLVNLRTPVRRVRGGSDPTLTGRTAAGRRTAGPTAAGRSHCSSSRGFSSRCCLSRGRISRCLSSRRP